MRINSCVPFAPFAPFAPWKERLIEQKFQRVMFDVRDV
jgi:hypothetical protein